MPNEQAKKSKKSLWWLVALVAIALAVGGGVLWYTQVKVPHDLEVAEHEAAVAEFNSAAEGLEAKNDALAKSISELEATINSENPPLDPELIQSSGALIGQAQAELVSVPAMPAETDEILAAASKMNEVPPFDTQIAKLEEALDVFEQSVAQMEQVTNPPEQFVIERITGLPNIVGVQAATEENDPNGKLNKQGGYTAAVFFTSDLVDRSLIYEEGDIVSVGTEGGGAVEVFSTVEDAESRNEYLAAFDGTILGPGSHSVVGTCIIRTSDHLTASQQEALTASIRDSLVRLD
ncbi:hypothetical protein [Schaalia sp. JY-X159]|uniref:hypothetical protein n=1 Tax=Schaalia sp. JY-X159 TaxID=2758575 RepID=UPI00165EA1A8|nr:hypothetical protein [Schaalia sp. JY-X159]